MLVKVLDSDEKLVWRLSRQSKEFPLVSYEVSLAPKAQVRSLRHEFTRNGLNSIKSDFLRQLAASGSMTGMFDEESIQLASKGLCPAGYDVHHIVPLSFGGKNRQNNFCLINRNAHRISNRRVFNEMARVLEKAQQDGETRPIYMEIPKFPAVVDTKSVYDYFKTKEQTEREVKISFLRYLQDKQKVKQKCMVKSPEKREKFRRQLSIIQSYILTLRQELYGKALPPTEYQRRRKEARRFSRTVSTNEIMVSSTSLPEEKKWKVHSSDSQRLPRKCVRGFKGMDAHY